MKGIKSKMHAILSLLSWIFCGDFGLLTMTPRYLFGVLFPVMVFVGFLAEILHRLQLHQKFHLPADSLLPLVVGLGCTTAAIASLDSPGASSIKTSLRHRMVWLLILLIPCSSQIAIIASFAALVTLRVFLSYLAFVFLFATVIWLILRRMYPSPPVALQPMPKQQSLPAIKPFVIVKEAFLSVTSTIPSFCIGSVLISVLSYCGVMDGISEIFAPWSCWMPHFWHGICQVVPRNCFGWSRTGLRSRQKSSAVPAISLPVNSLTVPVFCWAFPFRPERHWMPCMSRDPRRISLR